MNCKRLQDEKGKVTGFACGRFRKPKPCFYCGKNSAFLCDYPVKKSGKLKTCDVPLCADCTQKGVSPGVDFCKPHFIRAKAAYQRRQAKLNTE